MTENEHQLIIRMFAEQTRMLSTLLDVLVDRGVIQKDDLDAYDALQAETEPALAKGIGRDVDRIYREYAKAFGVTVGPIPQD
jgi:hypothetical protein